MYVLVTSIDPLRIYVYEEGLVRFASEKYSDDFSDRFQHLTNYSLNKGNKAATKEEEALKWSLSQLSKKLEKEGVDMNLIWSRIYDQIIKTFISVDHHI